MQHEENFKAGDIITGNCTVGNNVRVIEQYHQWVTIHFDGAINNTGWDCVYCDIAKVIL